MNDSSTTNRQSCSASRRASLSTAGRSTDSAVGLFGVTRTATVEPARRADSAKASRSSSKVTGSSATRSTCSGRSTFSYSLNDGTGIVILIVGSCAITLIMIIGLTVYNSVVFAEIIRAGIAALSRGQREAALALGPTNGQTLRLILLSRAVQIMLPALISQLVVVVVKDTSLGAFISYLELLSTGSLIVQNLTNPIQTYLVIAVVFILVNYTLSRLATGSEHRLSHDRRAQPGAAAAVTPEAVERRSAPDGPATCRARLARSAADARVAQ